MTTKKLIINRTFSAPISKVWEAFTIPEILVKWWYPDGMTNAHTSTEVRPGGEFRYCFKSLDYKEYWGKGVYQTITKPSFLSYLDTFTDANGNPVPPSHFGLPGDEITHLLIEVSLNTSGNKTHMQITMENPYDESMTENMTQSWNTMFDHLDKNLR